MITFSGIDGSGKTTQIEMLERQLKTKGIKYKRVWARGRCTPGVVLLKSVVRGDKNLDQADRDAYREKFHRSSRNRRILLVASILDLIWYFGIYYRVLDLVYNVLICDRYLWDTYIDFLVDYSECDFERWGIWRMACKVAPLPRTSILLMLSPERSIERCMNKQEAYMQDLPTKSLKVSAYRELAEAGRWTHVIDADQDVESVSREVLRSAGL